MSRLRVARRSRRATLPLQAGNGVVDESRMPMPRDAVGEPWGISQQVAESGPVRIPSQRIVSMSPISSTRRAVWVLE
jgi:hypothetical protein